MSLQHPPGSTTAHDRGRPLCDERRYRPFFIIGSGRCGATLLRAILTTKPELHVPPETYVLGEVIRAYPRYSRLPPDDLLRIILAHFEYHPEFPTFEITLRSLFHELRHTPGHELNLAYILNAIYMFHARKHKPTAKRWGDKTPLNTLYLEEIDSVFPDSRYVHLLRDGRDVVGSYVALGRYSIQEAAERWGRSVGLSRAMGARHPDRFFEIRYEELVTKPRAILHVLCEFLDLEFDERMLQHHKEDQRLGDVERLPHHAAVKTEINTESIGKWRAFFSEQEIQEVERALGTSLLTPVNNSST